MTFLVENSIKPNLLQHLPIGLSQDAEIFEKKAMFTKALIAEKTKEIMDNWEFSSPNEFLTRYVTPRIQKEIAKLELDSRVNIIFLNIVLEAFNEVAIKHPTNFCKMMMISMKVGDAKAHGKFFKETAFPLVKELINDLESNIPGFIEVTASKGLFNLKVLSEYGLD